jgi:GT2 family glycosyltransferase
VLNYNGGGLTRRCLDALAATEWPPGRLEIVLVDNGSSDGSVEEALRHRDGIRLIASETNVGYAAGNNLALRDLDGIGYVALVNNDAEVDKGWLAPLVQMLEKDITAGAACPKILFRPRFAGVELTCPPSQGRLGDRRLSGVRLSGIAVDGNDRWVESQFVKGWWEPEQGLPGPVTRLSAPSAQLYVPAGSLAELRLSADRPKLVQLRCRDQASAVQVGPVPAWHPIPLHAEPFDVINNAGNRLVEGGYGADRGYLEVDRGQFDSPAEVFGWCGAAVLLRPSYLRQVGLFDERLFLYYEDLDLSWRGRAQGWHYTYCPTSIVRHVHSATATEGSALSSHFVERNRLLVLAKNAPRRLAAAAVWRYLLTTASYARRDIFSVVIRGGRPAQRIPQQRLRALADYLRLLPSVILDRRQLRSRQSVSDSQIVGWANLDDY